MVIVRLTGGIGNQMFQYATARRIAWVNQAPLFMDLGWFDETGYRTRRGYELDAFRIIGQVAPPALVQAFKTRRQNLLFRRLALFLRKAIFHVQQALIIEKSYNFDPDILNLGDNVYLDGYWQSEKYFSDIDQVIRHEFSFKADVPEPNRRILDAITSSESVSIHIRRGDYVSQSKANAFHGLCPLTYYYSAVDQICRLMDNPIFFVFSDDIAWAKLNLNLGFETHFMDQNGPERGDEDLRLMSACRHHIIANSSFSWWGAWLCKNPKKNVYAPQKWFNRDADTPDNIPASWVKL